MEEEEQAAVNFISCIAFVARGIAKENPEKVNLSPEELNRIIAETKSELRDGEEEEEMKTSDDEAPSENDENMTQPAPNNGDEYQFDKYETEGGQPGMRIGDVAVAEDDGQLPDEEDSEAEDEIIKRNDNLILVGHIEDDAATMEVYIYNEQEDSLYVHHDFLLPSHPLCIEWLSYDPGSEEPGNLCAIGCMDPIITIWDLDIQDSLEPTFKLGSKGSRKKNKEKFGHTDAVLDLSWNRNLPHIMASGSVDETVILWDLDEGSPHTTIRDFNEKVQTLSFHFAEPESLLVGSCDGTVKLFDCRATDNSHSEFTSWDVKAEVERVVWNKHNPNCFMVSTNDGMMHYFDRRNAQGPLWQQSAHEKEVTGLVLAEHVDGMLCTASADGTVKVWDYDQNGATLIFAKHLKMGVIQNIQECPENSFILGVGGDVRKKNFQRLNLLDYEQVSNKFKDRSLVKPEIAPPTQAMEDMEV
ncbi:periodic tryptophan protein 1 homolog [Culicoides brevitarsis]|uniref:periodic tryptophan protein 1 homolog n=1 Tax=Culicoides brevitarsis TaxID=469753 RepID=UPI00307B7FAB